MATVMMGGEYTRPKKMVSHSWGALFRDLVAAVVADGLGDSEFGLAAALLERGEPSLRNLLRARGTLQDTYWVCAFSVSQHSAICSDAACAGVDPVLCRPHPTCACRTPKYRNGDPPVREDGKSILCELNKFTDMIEFLAATDDAFEQVIAVDAQAKVFTRAWVVDEIATAHRLGMPQHLKVRRASVVDEHEESLRRLRVQDMQATRREDVDDILVRIPDTRAFNAHLQHIIFDVGSGLIASWRAQDAQQKLERVGRALLVARLCMHEQDRGVETGDDHV